MGGRVALVTGAAAGIGRACAMRLAEEGHAIGILDLDQAAVDKVAEEIKAAGGRAIGLSASVTDRAAIKAAVDTLRAEFGPVTIVVNNAGVTDFTPFEEVTDELFDKVYSVNVKGVFIVTQAVLPDMKAEKWGRIVNLSSSSAQTGAVRMPTYSSSKGAIVTFTRSLAQELGPLGITVNNIPPGSIMDTVMSQASISKMPMGMDELVQTIPVRRVGQARDIANACAFLASEASGYVTGQTLGVNGGRVVS